MNETVATLEEIGTELEAARVAAGRSDKEVADAAGVSLTSLHRWKTGQADPAARSLTLAALSVGKTPNDLLLRDTFVASQLAEFDENDRADLSRLIKCLRVLKSLNEDKISPVKIFAECALTTERIVREGRGLPPGHSVKVEDDATLYEPAEQSRTDSKRMVNSISGIDVMAGEDTPEYGDKNKNDQK